MFLNIFAEIQGTLLLPSWRSLEAWTVIVLSGRKDLSSVLLLLLSLHPSRFSLGTQTLPTFHLGEVLSLGGVQAGGDGHADGTRPEPSLRTFLKTRVTRQGWLTPVGWHVHAQA